MYLKIGTPPQRKIVVFDGKSLDDLHYILHDEDFAVIENRKCRIKVIYCGLSFLVNCILNYILLFFKNKNIHTIYLYTLIKKINPRTVITSIDNSFKFADLAFLLSKKIKFIAVQNANRFDYLHNDYFLEKKIKNINLNQKYFIPNFYCFGQHEIDECKKYNINVKKFNKVGSIRVANFFKYIETKSIKLNKARYDICLISEVATNINKKFKINGLEENFAKVAKLSIKYSKKYNLKFLFLQKKPNNSVQNKIEIDFYKKYLETKEFNFLINNSNIKKSIYSSYLGLFESKIAIGAQSTLLRDKLGCKEKVLSLNINNKGLFEFPINGICKLKKLDFTEFESRLNNISHMNINEYLSKLDRPVDYMMEFDKKSSVIEKVRNNLY